MDTKLLLEFFGCSASNKELEQYMSELSISLADELSLSDGQYRAYIERPKDGYCLIFTDEAYFLGKPNHQIGAGELFYAGIFFHSEGKDGYSQYQGSLPFGLLFSDTRADVINKLGEQSWQRLARDDDRVISDRWDALESVSFRLHVTYDKDSGKISVVSASVPDELQSAKIMGSG